MLKEEKREPHSFEIAYEWNVAKNNFLWCVLLYAKGIHVWNVAFVSEEKTKT